MFSNKIIASVILSLACFGAVQTEACGLFKNRPVVRFFQNKQPVRRIVKAPFKAVKYVRQNKPVRSALFCR